MNNDSLKAAVREYYARRIVAGTGCGAPATGQADAGCCASPAAAAGPGCCTPERSAVAPPGVDEVPSYGCGTPFEASVFRRGDVVVDLGSGPGRDALFAGQAVAPGGRVIGVDMTPEMIERARLAAGRAGLTHVEFRLGDIEALPVADAAADVVISNCVLTLVPDKRRALAEAYRVLRRGGRLIVNDIVAEAPLPDEVRNDPETWSACISGAVTAEEYRALLAGVGFTEIGLAPNGEGAGAYATYSARVTARKP